MKHPRGTAPADPGLSTRPAWYAAPGGWRDWLSILHPPYTAWHLSYVLIGAGLAPHLSVYRLLATLIAFFLAVGIAAHGFDELRGRPLGTTVSAIALAAVSSLALTGAVVVGVVGISRLGFGLLGFILVGAVVVVAYNLEVWNGRLHNDAMFGLSWGAFPVLTSYFAQTGTLRPTAFIAAAFAYGLSAAQRTLSTEARDLRRRTASITGEKVRRDGKVEPLSRHAILAPLERALIALSWSTCALGAALVLARA